MVRLKVCVNPAHPTQHHDRGTETDLHSVHRHGWPITHAALDPERCRFRVDGLAGLIACTQLGRCAVVLGNPICAPDDQCRLAAAFADHARQQGWSAVVAVASARLRDKVLGTGAYE